jgi:long-chain acyl-CoA synthetase
VRELQNRPWKKYYQDEMPHSEFPEVSLYSILAESTIKYGEHVAITFNNQEITYKELKSQTDRLASNWKEMGFEKGERIVLMADNHPDYIVSYYAALALGLIIVQINPASTPLELLKILADSKASYIIADVCSLKTVCEIYEFYEFKQIMTIEIGRTVEKNYFFRIEDLKRFREVLELPVAIEAKEDIAVIQYTRGTTGKLKGAMLTHHNLTANVYQNFTMYSQRIVPGKEIVLGVMPLYHIYAMTSTMNLGIHIGANILVVEKFNVDQVMQLIKEYKPTFFPGVPKMYDSFVNYPKAEEYGLDCFKICSSGSASLPIELIRKFESLSGKQIIEGFGMSETSPTTHRTPINGEQKVGSIGIPIPGTDSCILGHDPKDFQVNIVGELLVRGPQVMKGYWNNEAATKQALQGGWFHTGDLAKMDEDGYFYIVGRKKEMIVFGGINIYPQEIEEVLYEYNDIREASVVGLSDETYGEIVKAYVVPIEGREINVDELLDYCYAKLSPFKVPKEIIVTENSQGMALGSCIKDYW